MAAKSARSSRSAECELRARTSRRALRHCGFPGVRGGLRLPAGAGPARRRHQRGHQPRRRQPVRRALPGDDDGPRRHARPAGVHHRSGPRRPADRAVPGAPGHRRSRGGRSARGLPPGDKGNTDVGVTKDSITLANIADISGPVPGLFESAQQATKAFVAYWNATYGGVCGRQLKLKTYDSGTASNGTATRRSRPATRRSPRSAPSPRSTTAARGVGQQCGIADFSAAAVTKAHQAATNTYAASATKAGCSPRRCPSTSPTRTPRRSARRPTSTSTPAPRPRTPRPTSRPTRSTAMAGSSSTCSRSTSRPSTTRRSCSR